MELQQLEKKIISINSLLYSKLKEHTGLIHKYAESEKNYRISLASKMTELKINGQPATLIPDLARGDKVVADLKMKRDIAKGVSDACRQAIISHQSSLSSIQTLISNRKAEMKLI